MLVWHFVFFQYCQNLKQTWWFPRRGPDTLELKRNRKIKHHLFSGFFLKISIVASLLFWSFPFHGANCQEKCAQHKERNTLQHCLAILCLPLSFFLFWNGSVNTFHNVTLVRGWKRSTKGKKQKELLASNPKNRTAQVGWPKRLGLVQVTLWADFAVIAVQLCSTIRAIFPCVALSWYDCSLLRIILDCPNSK